MAQSAGGAISPEVPFQIRLLVALRVTRFTSTSLYSTGLVRSIRTRKTSECHPLNISAPSLLYPSLRQYLSLPLGDTGFSAAWAFYLITLLPVIGLMQVGSQPAADRYMYLPSFAPFILLGILAGYLASRQSVKNKKGAYLVGAVTVLLSALLSIATVRQISIWKDPVTMWKHVIKVYPDSYLARYNLSGVY